MISGQTAINAAGTGSRGGRKSGNNSRRTACFPAIRLFVRSVRRHSRFSGRLVWHHRGI